MEAVLPLMENASVLDWLTVGGLLWLVWRERQLARNLEKHEDMCALFRKGYYDKTVKMEKDITRIDTKLNERTKT